MYKGWTIPERDCLLLTVKRKLFISLKVRRKQLYILKKNQQLNNNKS